MPKLFQDKLDRAVVVAKKKDKSMNRSAFVRNLIEKYVHEEEDVTFVTLKIPTQMCSNSDVLKQWLDTRVPTLLQALTKTAIPSENTHA